ncbi:MAG: hypothetical protein EAX96_17180 [Candidatus Lokiarchaeota archaeon]|nr:hypothetical protein [Candidatus Lokiarchaeota archaeon]
MKYNTVQVYTTLLIILFIGQISFGIYTTTKTFEFLNKNNLPQTDNIFDIEQNSTLSNIISNIYNFETPKITLFQGSFDDKVNISISTFLNYINHNITINLQTSLSFLMNNTSDIILIFSHGCEQGLIINNTVIP